MSKKIALYPITVAPDWDDEPFDSSALPIEVVPGVTVESVIDSLKKDEFEHFKGHLAKRDVEALQGMNPVIIYRYETDIYGQGQQEAEAMVRNIAACLMLIRPTDQRVGYVHGEVRSDNTFCINGFDTPPDVVSVPPVQKLFAVRNGDLQRLQRVAPDFIRGMKGEFWKFRVPVVLYESGHFGHHYWKGRFASWCSALDAVYTTQPEFDKPQPYEHSGSVVAKARIRWLLGEKTSIYAPGDIQSVDNEQPNITVGDVLDDLYELRNSVVHGDKTPDKFFVEKRIAYGQRVNLGDVLHEALSFIIRASLLKILEEDLLNHFADGPASQAYFLSHGLVKSLLPKIKTSNAVP
jgi:hypothetical protein